MYNQTIILSPFYLSAYIINYQMNIIIKSNAKLNLLVLVYHIVETPTANKYKYNVKKNMDTNFSRRLCLITQRRCTPVFHIVKYRIAVRSFDIYKARISFSLKKIIFYIQICSNQRF